jgi:hypothetical protein
MQRSRTAYAQMERESAETHAAAAQSTMLAPVYDDDDDEYEHLGRRSGAGGGGGEPGLSDPVSLGLQSRGVCGPSMLPSEDSASMSAVARGTCINVWLH